MYAFRKSVSINRVPRLNIALFKHLINKSRAQLTDCFMVPAFLVFICCRLHLIQEKKKLQYAALLKTSEAEDIHALPNSGFTGSLPGILYGHCSHCFNMQVRPVCSAQSQQSSYLDLGRTKHQDCRGHGPSLPTKDEGGFGVYCRNASCYPSSLF